jgi:hypothetical protein
MHRQTLLAAACTLALAACATSSEGTSATAAASKGDFTPTGSVSGFTGNASFDATRVVGPKINASLRSDGTWGGTIGDRPLFHAFKDGTLSGPDLTLNITKAGDVLTITGQIQGRILRFEVSPALLRVRTDTRSMDFNGDGTGVYSGMKTVTFTGDAVGLPPTVPMALALTASFM